MTHSPSCIPSYIFCTRYGICDFYAWQRSHKWNHGNTLCKYHHSYHRHVWRKNDKKTRRSWHTSYHPYSRIISYGCSDSNTRGDDIFAYQTKLILVYIIILIICLTIPTYLSVLIRLSTLATRPISRNELIHIIVVSERNILVVVFLRSFSIANPTGLRVRQERENMRSNK